MAKPVLYNTSSGTRQIRSIIAADSAIGSGVIVSGTVANNSINSGNISSGQVGSLHISSGAVTSGNIGSQAVTSGSIASGTVGSVHIGSGQILSGNIASGQIGVNHLASGSVRSGAIASGQIGSFHIASGSVTSGNIGSQAVTSGSIASGTIGSVHIGSGQILSGNIASGQIGINHLASGIIQSGAAGITSGATIDTSQQVQPYKSGTPFVINTAELISGIRAVSITSSGTLQIAMASVVSRMPAIGVVPDNISSGQPATVTTIGHVVSTSGVVGLSGQIGKQLYVGRSGQITAVDTGFNSGGFLSGDLLQIIGLVDGIDSAFINTYPLDVLSQGLITSGDIASGQIGNAHIASGGVLSGNIASGQVGINHLSNSSINSGKILSGQIGNAHIASGGVLSGNIASGQIGVSHLASGSVRSGAIASGQIGTNHLSSGAVTSGNVGNNAINSGNISSGQIGPNHLASGTITIPSGTTIDTSQQVLPYKSGSPFIINTAELISGIRAVSITSSGALQIAMASIESKMPAIGVVRENIASGQPANVITIGHVDNISGSLNLSGQIGRQLYVGRSGQLGTIDTGYNSGGFFSGDLVQILGLIDGLESLYINSYPIDVQYQDIILSGDIGSGQIGSFHLSSGSVTSGRIASGQVGSNHLSSGAVTSGNIGNAAITSGNIASGQIGTAQIASGGVLSGNIASGQIGLSHLASGSVRSGAIASGQIGSFHIASGAVTSGNIGSNAIASGNLASGAIGVAGLNNHVQINTGGQLGFNSGFLLDGTTVKAIKFESTTSVGIEGGEIDLAGPSSGWFITSGVRIDVYENTLRIFSRVSPFNGYYLNLQSGGTTASRDLVGGGGASFTLTSGIIRSGHIGDAAVVSGNIASGQIGNAHIASGGVLSGNIASGQIGTNHISSGAVTSGNIASGQVGLNHLASGSVRSGVIASGQIGSFHIASGGVLSGNIASGQIGPNHFNSGAIINAARNVILAGLTTEETVSGFRAVNISHSGRIRIANPNISGRMPAIGINITNVLSGQAVDIVTHGIDQAASGMVNFSGYIGRELYVGSGGLIITGGSVVSGIVAQRIGQCLNSGGLLVNPCCDYSGYITSIAAAPPAPPPIPPPSPPIPPPAPFPPPPPLPPCWVAREVYGESDIRWVKFNYWLMTMAPTWLRNLYLKHGERYATTLNDDTKQRLRTMMDAKIGDLVVPESYIKDKFKEFSLARALRAMSA